MRHDLLADLIPDGDSGDHIATIPFGSRRIEIRISPDDQPFETTLRLAAEVVAGLGALDQAAKRVAVLDLRSKYNGGWNEYDEAQADGTLKRVSNPALSEPEFEQKLSLTAVNVAGEAMIDYFYDDQDMFWGHGVHVTSFVGLSFSDARAELIG